LTYTRNSNTKTKAYRNQNPLDKSTSGLWFSLPTAQLPTYPSSPLPPDILATALAEIQNNYPLRVFHPNEPPLPRRYGGHVITSINDPTAPNLSGIDVSPPSLQLTTAEDVTDLTKAETEDAGSWIRQFTLKRNDCAKPDNVERPASIRDTTAQTQYIALLSDETAGTETFNHMGRDRILQEEITKTSLAPPRPRL
jgi:hypothetical protein